MSKLPTWDILCQNSLKWLKQQPDQSIANVLTGIPDLNELPHLKSPKDYIDFFNRTCLLIFNKVKPDGYCIFIQTDRKLNGQLDKSYLLTNCSN
jgi:hypothetical protein